MSEYSRRAMGTSGLAMLLAVLAVLAAEPALSQGRPASSVVDLARAADSLQPGEWVWAPEIAISLSAAIDAATGKAPAAL